MPGLTGVQRLARMRECRPDLPVIVMSGYEEGELIRGLQAPAGGPPADGQEAGPALLARVRFLPKPFTGIQLAEAIGALLVASE